jgi:ribonucleoside-diphosphate reductase alpha chain
MDGSVTGRMIAENGMRNSNVLAIGHDFIAARRQKWIDPSQFVNLFLATLEMQCATARSTMNRTDRRAWDKAPRCGAIKTTCYLRTLEASNVEKSTTDVQKVQRGVMATATAATASAAAKAFTEAEKNACSLEAMMNGGECEACQ